MMDLTIELATGTSESLSTLTTSNGMTLLEPSMEEIKVRTDGAAFNTARSGKTLSSFKISAIPHTNPGTEEKIDLGHGTEGEIGPFFNREVEDE